MLSSSSSSSSHELPENKTVLEFISEFRKNNTIPSVEQLEGAYRLNKNIKYRTKDGYTALHFASCDGFLDTVKWLLLKGADINAQDKNLYTPLLFAVINNHHEIAQYLLEQKASVDLAEKDNRTPLTYASFKGNQSITELLLLNSANPNPVDDVKYGPLYQRKSLATTKLLVMYGADINAKGYKNRTPLQHEKEFKLSPDDVIDYLTDLEKRQIKAKAYKNVLELIQEYHDKNDSPSAVELDVAYQNSNKLDFTIEQLPLLHFAANYGYQELLLWLLRKKVNVNAKTEKGETALDFAIRSGHTNIVRVLLYQGVDINSCGELSSYTPLMLATRYNREAEMKMLIEHKADVNSVTINGTTALDKAVSFGHVGIVRLLIDAKATLSHVPFSRDEEINKILKVGASNAQENEVVPQETKRTLPSLVAKLTVVKNTSPTSNSLKPPREHLMDDLAIHFDSNTHQSSNGLRRLK